MFYSQPRLEWYLNCTQYNEDATVGLGVRLSASNCLRTDLTDISHIFVFIEGTLFRLRRFPGIGSEHTAGLVGSFASPVGWAPNTSCTT